MGTRGRKLGQKARQKRKLTQRLIDSLPTPEKMEIHLDAELPGFGCAKYPSGTVGFLIQYSVDGRQRRMSIGKHGPMTVVAARKKALALLAQAQDGDDPAENAAARRAMPTLDEWAEQHLERKRATLKHPDHVAYYLRFGRERFGKRKLDKITTTDISAMVLSLQNHGKTNVTANRAFAALRGCLNEAVKFGHIPYNPALGVTKGKEPKPRTRILSEEELSRLLAALEAEPDPWIRTAFLMMLATGCRRGELLSARWEHIDLERGLWTLPDTKSGDEQHIPLPPKMVDYLHSVPRAGDYLIPGRLPDKPRNDGLKKPWQRLKKAAGLDDLRMHDLRRTVGTMVAKAHGIYAASRLLRHSTVQVTETHYAHLSLDTLRPAVTDLASRVLIVEENN